MKKMTFKKFKKIPYSVCTVRDAIAALFGQISEKNGTLESQFFAGRQAYLTSYLSDTFILLAKKQKKNHADSVQALCEFHEVENFLNKAENMALEKVTPPSDLTDRQEVRSYRENKAALVRKQNELEQRISEAKSKRTKLLNNLSEFRQQDKDLMVQSRELFVKAEQCTERQISAYTYGATWFRRRFKGCKPPVLVTNTIPETLYLEANSKVYDEINRIVEKAAIVM